jgi:hypothetical protein
MSSASENKEIRQELELLTEEIRALSAIYSKMQEYISEEQQNDIRTDARKFVYSIFSKDTIESCHDRKANLAIKSPLESVFLDVVKPKETKT